MLENLYNPFVRVAHCTFQNVRTTTTTRDVSRNGNGNDAGDDARRDALLDDDGSDGNAKLQRSSGSIRGRCSRYALLLGHFEVHLRHYGLYWFRETIRGAWWSW